MPTVGEYLVVNSLLTSSQINNFSFFTEDSFAIFTDYFKLNFSDYTTFFDDLNNAFFIFLTANDYRYSIYYDTMVKIDNIYNNVDVKTTETKNEDRTNSLNKTMEENGSYTGSDKNTLDSTVMVNDDSKTIPNITNVNTDEKSTYNAESKVSGIVTSVESGDSSFTSNSQNTTDSTSSNESSSNNTKTTSDITTVKDLNAFQGELSKIGFEGVNVVEQLEKYRNLGGNLWKLISSEFANYALICVD